MSSVDQWILPYTKGHGVATIATSATGSKNSPQQIKKFNFSVANVADVAKAQSPAAWDATDWQAFFDERAGIAEHDGGEAREKAELMAFESCIAHWLNKNPPAHSNPDACPQCCQLVGTNALAVLTGNGRHIWLHDKCHLPWLARRRQEAIAALVAMEIFNRGDSL